MSEQNNLARWGRQRNALAERVGGLLEIQQYLGGGMSPFGQRVMAQMDDPLTRMFLEGFGMSAATVGRVPSYLGTSALALDDAMIAQANRMRRAPNVRPQDAARLRQDLADNPFRPTAEQMARQRAIDADAARRLAQDLADNPFGGR